jgi:hypothetical protein
MGSNDAVATVTARMLHLARVGQERVRTGPDRETDDDLVVVIGAEDGGLFLIGLIRTRNPAMLHARER